MKKIVIFLIALITISSTAQTLDTVPKKQSRFIPYKSRRVLKNGNSEYYTVNGDTVREKLTKGDKVYTIVKGDTISWEWRVGSPQYWNKRIKEEYGYMSPIKIKVSFTGSDYAGQVLIDMIITNCSPKSIKYVTVKANLINSVGDKIRDEISGSTVLSVRAVGPIEAMPSNGDNYEERKARCSQEFDFATRFYTELNYTYQVYQIVIQYMDNKVVTLSGSNAMKHVVWD